MTVTGESFKAREKTHIDLSFSAEAIKHLSLDDQVRFQNFGQGPKVTISHPTIYHAIKQQVQRNPNSIAAIWKRREMSYGELDKQANKLSALLASHGVKHGDKVGLFINRSFEMLVGILACLKLGATYVPQDVGVSGTARLKYIIDVAKIKVALTLSSFKTKVPVSSDSICIAIDEVVNGNLDFDADLLRPGPSLDNMLEAEDICFVLFTSGTTGNPNGVQVTHRNLCNILLTKPGNLGMKPGYKVSQLLNIAFDMAAWEILTCLAHGATLLIREKDFTATARDADVIIATPSVLAQIDSTQCTNIKTVAVAGEPCPLSLANEWANICQFYNCCGPTETTIINTMQDCPANADHITIGKPTPNNTVYILNEDKLPCAIGETGVMWAGGGCVTAGYINNDELNQKRYAPDFFKNDGSMMFCTGDLGRWTSDGQLEHLGRVDDQVKVRGFRVELDGVSSAMEATAGCQRAVTLKLDDRNLVGFVTPAIVDTKIASEKVAAQLPYYCVPSFVLALESFPKTDRGKIDKRALLKIAEEYRQPKIVGKSGQVIDDVSKEIIKKKLKPREDTPQSFDPDLVTLPPELPKWKRIWKGEKLMHYNRLIALIGVVNIAMFIYGIGKEWWWTPEAFILENISHMLLANLTMAILIRQQYIVNMLFGIATSAPVSWPLWIRRRLGKVYHFGGIHVGGAIFGTFWYAFLVGASIYGYVNSIEEISMTNMLISIAILMLLAAMLLLSRSSYRAKYHDNFERMHRFGGWTMLLLFWVHTFVVIYDTTVSMKLSEALLRAPGFWMLTLITISIILPWLKLRKVPIKIENPSSHVALVSFDEGVETPFAGSSTAISRNPLMEWHSFANVPSPNKTGFRLTISRAGDWTGEFIDDLPTHVWIKGIHTAGVGNIDQLFKKVIWVATGSGIGPCLPHLLAQEVPSRLVWATRNPTKTYGEKLVGEIKEAQPEAIIWDTDAYGKPDMVKLAYQVYKEFDAEAVICISNKKLTWRVVSGLESRGIPAYGAIWDS